jgi:uncharacterized membrane protein YphA (DoxX/SURF4 family)
MNFRTRFVLVLLQLCTGWHLFYEGIWKQEHRDTWTSKAYLRGATGPLALPMRWLAGDPEVVRDGFGFRLQDTTADFLARFEPTPFDPSEPVESRKPHRHLPPPVDEEWNAFFDAFVRHYGLDDPDRRDQRARAESKLLQAKTDAVGWLLTGVRKEKPPNFRGTADVPRTTPQRLEKLRDKLRQARDLETTDAAVFGSAATAPQVRQLRNEAAALREGLRSDLDARLADLKRTLYWEVLTPEQRRMDAVPRTPAAGNSWGRVEWLDDLMSPAFARVGWGWPSWDRVQWIDFAVRWGLIVAGAGLLLGFFTRTSCAVGCILLALFYLAMPPLPGAPDSPAGHYLLINLNVIEVVALLLIAVSHPAARYGLDAWMPFRRLRRRRAQPARITRPVSVT